jgi:PAS domain S-box-containing protein
MTAFPLYEPSDVAGRPGIFSPKVEEALADVARLSDWQEVFVLVVNSSTCEVEDVIGPEVSPVILDLLAMRTEDPGPIARAMSGGKIVRVNDVLPFAHGRHGETRPLCFAVIPLPPCPAVLVVSRDRAIAGKDFGGLMPHVAKLAALLWEHLSLPLRPEAGKQVLTAAGRFSQMLDAVPDPVVLTDSANKILVANAAARRLLEVAPDDPPGKCHAVELNHFLLSAALSSFTLGQGERLERELTLADPVEGSELLFELICQSAQSAAPGGHTLVSVLRNVTDLLQASEETHRSQRQFEKANQELGMERDRLRLILEHVANPIVVSGPGNEIVLMNSAAERFLGSSQPLEAGGKAVHYANETRFSSFLLDSRLNLAMVQQGELRFVDPLSDQELEMSATATKVRNEAGMIVATVSVLQDLTQVKELERRRLERQLFESEKLAAVGRLAAAVAHEMNNPLEAIKNCLHLVTADFPERDRNRRFLDIANKEIRRVAEIVQQMLGFYRPGLVRKQVDVNGIIEEALELLERQLRWKEIRLTRELAEELPRITGSPDQIKQVFLNLLLNAAEAISDRGEIRVVSRPADNGARGVVVEVHDTGSGIAQEDLEHVFEPFFSKKSEGRGSGLGLWVSRDIIQQHGGTISVQSRPGRGTTLILELPEGRENVVQSQ